MLCFIWFDTKREKELKTDTSNMASSFKTLDSKSNKKNQCMFALWFMAVVRVHYVSVAFPIEWVFFKHGHYKLTNHFVFYSLSDVRKREVRVRGSERGRKRERELKSKRNRQTDRDWEREKEKRYGEEGE